MITRRAAIRAESADIFAIWELFCDCIAISGVSARRRSPKCCSLFLISLFLINFCQSPRPRAPRGSSDLRTAHAPDGAWSTMLCSRRTCARGTCAPRSRSPAAPRARGPAPRCARWLGARLAARDPAGARSAPSISRHLARAIGNIFQQYTTLRVACVCACAFSCVLRFVRLGGKHSSQGTPAAAPSCQVCRRLVLVT